MKELTGTEVNGIGFKLQIRGDVYDKVMHWIRAHDTEISGYGTVEFDAATKIFTVVEASLLDISKSSSETTILPELANRYFNKTRNNNSGKWHWHSHPTFGAFWSGTDKSLIRGLGQNQKFLTATVFNQKAESKSAFYQLTEVMGLKHEIFIEDMPTSIIRLYDEDVIASWDAEMEEVKRQVEEHRPKTTYSTPGNYYSPGSTNYYSPGNQSWLGLRDWENNWKDNQKPWLGVAPKPDKKTSDGTPIDEFGDDGWMYSSKQERLYYNPTRDRTINRSDDAVWQELIALENDEFKFLYREDNKFKAFVDNNLDADSRKEFLK
jgi:hypothetical protein